MSVLINMEMPTSCRACHLKMNCDDCEGYECVCVPLHQQIGYLDDLLADKRRDDCPLVPVPPHGDLIDRRYAIATACSGRIRTLPTTEDGENWIRVKEVRDSIKAAPTIIPAEPPKDEAPTGPYDLLYEEGGANTT